MSFAVLVRDVLDQTEGSTSTEEIAALLENSLVALLGEHALRADIYEQAMEDPMIGDDVDMMVIGLVIDSLVSVLQGKEKIGG